MPPWSLPVTALAGSLALTACGGGGSPSLPTSQPLSSTSQQTPPPAQEPTLPPGAPLVSEQHFHYNLTRAGQVPIAQTPARRSGTGPQAISGNSTARKIQAHGTISIRSLAPWLTTPPSPATASGDNTATQQWYLARSRGRLPMPGGPGADPSKPPTPGPRAETTDAHPTGTGSATWRGIAEAASTADFQRLTGTANLTIPDLSQPRLTAEIDPDKTDGSTAELRWPDISLTNGRFSQGSAADHHIYGRFTARTTPKPGASFTPTPTWAHSVLCGNYNSSSREPS